MTHTEAARANALLPPADQWLEAETAAAPPWLAAWWRFVDFKIGVVPAPIFILVIAVVVGFLATGGNTYPADILMNIAVLSVGGFACAEVGKRLPVLNQIGTGAIFATFIPSYLVFAHLLPKPLVSSITDFTKQSNFLYLFISAIIVGSILGMDRKVLITGFLKIFVPLGLGSIAALVVGMGVGMAFGLEPHHTLYYVVLPVLAGGVGEGAIPLSVGYGQILHQPSGPLLATILPAVMFGSLTAIVLAGLLNMWGKRTPGLTGEGRLTIGEDDYPLADDGADRPRPTTQTVAAAAVTAVTLYLVGALAQKVLNWPGPVTMLFIAVVLKLGRVFSPSLEQGAFAVYQFFRTAVTYPLLFAIGVSLTPWDKLIAAFTVANVVTIVATVVAMVGTGFGVARLIGMYPIDVGIVAACRCGQGGTGDVAILTAANRMQLMPFAQIATRIGGAVTVTLALIALAKFGGL
jgi:malate:Na+ symporter